MAAPQPSPERTAKSEGPTANREERSPTRWHIWVALFLILVGSALRVRLYAAEQSFWWDEASIADNIATRSFAGLLRPLDHDQAAPVGWLLLVKAAAVAFGQGERSLRLVPLLASLAAMPALLLLARRLLPPGGALLALGLLAVCPSAIAFGADAKQYSTDALAAILATLAAVRAMQSGLRLRDLAVLAATGAALIYISHPVVFVLAAAGLAMAVCWLMHRSARTLAGLAAVAVAWAAAFAVDWALFLQHVSRSEFMRQFWLTAFAPPPTTAEAWHWYADRAVHTFRVLGGFELPRAAIACSLLGMLAIGRRSPLGLLVLVGPAGVALVASGFGKYPIHERMLMFLTPAILLTIAGGIWLLSRDAGALVSWVRRDRQRSEACGDRVASFACGALAIALAVFVACGPLERAWRTAVAPNSKGSADIAPLMRHISANWQDGDTIYAHWGLAMAFRYYATRTDRLPRTEIVESPRAESQEQYLDDLRRLSERVQPNDRGRVWVAFGNLADVPAWEAMLEPLRIDGHRAPRGAQVVLCDLRRLRQ